MDLDVIFWLVVGGFYLLRVITRKKKGKQPTQQRPQQRPQRSPESQQRPQPRPEQPQPDVSHITVETASPGEETSTPAEIEIGQALTELRTALGFGQTQAPSPSPVLSTRRDEEVFGGTEERFEKEVPFHEIKGTREDRFEKRAAYSVSDEDREDVFERRDFYKSGPGTYEDRFEEQPAWREVEFKDRWKGHKSDFEYHSPLEKHGKEASKPALEPDPQVTQQMATGFSLFAKFNHVNDLQKAVLLHEILGPPISQRTPSARRRPS